MANNIHRNIQVELLQTADSRKPIIRRVEKEMNGRKLVSFFTSFAYPVDITDDDCDMLQSVLQQIDTQGGIVLMISSPGGDGLAAERIVNICRAHSGTGDYWALVPGKAKSAATIVCMGASKVLMAPTSELGPIDPQIIRLEDNRLKVFSAHSLVNGYDRLFNEAVNTQGMLEPYLQQLVYYDDREITNYRNTIALTENIAVKLLKDGMMKGKSDKKIKDSINIFLDPSAGTVSHGRPIYMNEVKDSGLIIEELDVTSKIWTDIYELYARTDRFVSSQACKAVESFNESFFVAAPE